MKRSRLIYFILWAASLAGISFFGGPVSYGLFAMLTILPIVSIFYLLCVFFFFRIYQELDSRNLVANHSVPFFFTLMNEYHFGFVGIRVRFYTSFSAITGLDDGTEYELLPQTGIKMQTALLCKYRGEYEVGIKRVELQDYLRLLRISYHNRESLRVVVKPDLVDLTELRSVNVSHIMARESSLHPTDPDVLVRPYEMGDDVRRIHWKSSARIGMPVVRGQIGEEQEGISVLMGTCRFSKAPEEYLPIENKMLEVTLALALFFVKKRIPVRTCHLAKGIEEHQAESLEQFETIYSAFSTVEFDEERTEAAFLEQAGGNRNIFRSKAVFLILHEWTPQAQRLLRLLADKNIYTMVYVVGHAKDIASDTALPPESGFLVVAPDADLTEVM